MRNDHELADLLLEIEAEMRRIGLWGTRPPAPERLESRTPFCYDTLTFPEWLQWVFVPGVKRLIEEGSEPPEACHILPYAEYWFEEEEGTYPVELLRLIRRFDETANV